jgi:hypothetical protein
VTVAAIVTPLGLYETIAPDKGLTPIDFHYARDTSALGAGTAPRPSLGFSRICRGGDLACPNSGQDVKVVNVTGSGGFIMSGADAPYGYDTRIPRRYFDYLESGVSGSTLNRSVSSTFDIQWRTWTTTALNATDILGTKNSSFYNNGSTYALGSYRSLTNVLLNDAWDVVEGLIVDTKNGGVGFRNHTIPSQPLPYGAQWSEDILFVEPVTECVNLNVSVDFTLATETYSSAFEISNARLVDQGGFVDFDRHGLPLIAIGNQSDPLLAQRAQTGAWLTNMLMMLVWNVTDRNPNGSISLAPPFTYLNSQLGKEFPLPTNGLDKKPAATYLTSYNSLVTYSDLSTFFSTLTPLPSTFDNGTNPFNYTQLPPNPYQYPAYNMTAYGKMHALYFCESAKYC